MNIKDVAVGMLIRCVNDTDCRSVIENGRVYKVASVSKDLPLVYLSKGTETTPGYFDHRFVPACDDYFRVGDKVRCIDVSGGGATDLAAGKEYLVTEKRDEEVCLDGKPYSWMAKRFDLVSRPAEDTATEATAAPAEEPLPQRLVTITAAGLTINLDVSKPLGALIAHAIIDAVEKGVE